MHSSIMIFMRVFMSQPEGFIDSTHPTYVCKLSKALYGLKQVPRAWFEKLKGALVSQGFTNSKSNTSLFFFRKDNKLLFVLIYIDDILLTGEHQSQVKNLVHDLNQQFALKTLSSINYFLGFEVFPDPIGIYHS